MWDYNVLYWATSICCETPRCEVMLHRHQFKGQNKLKRKPQMSKDQFTCSNTFCVWKWNLAGQKCQKGCHNLLLLLMTFMFSWGAFNVTQSSTKMCCFWQRHTSKWKSFYFILKSSTDRKQTQHWCFICKFVHFELYLYMYIYIFNLLQLIVNLWGQLVLFSVCINRPKL